MDRSTQSSLIVLLLSGFAFAWWFIFIFILTAVKSGENNRDTLITIWLYISCPPGPLLIPQSDNSQWVNPHRPQQEKLLSMAADHTEDPLRLRQACTTLWNLYLLIGIWYIIMFITLSKNNPVRCPHLCSSKNKCTLIKEHNTLIPHAPTSPAGHKNRVVITMKTAGTRNL